jgi:thiamine-phosphate pyrophosphorylase
LNQYFPRPTDLPGKPDNIYRVLDANLNRLREALRVIEEYFRFMDGREDVCITLKKMRHSLVGVEGELGNERLLGQRDTPTDCFAETTRPEELARAGGVDALLCANFKRGQEALRVIEEYSKLVSAPSVPETAKRLRFTLYNLEKTVMGTGHETH